MEGAGDFRYFDGHVMWCFEWPTLKAFTTGTEFCAVVERLKDVPVHVHCSANARVSVFFYRIRRDVLGMNETRARAEMEAVWQPKGIWAGFAKQRGERT